MFLNTKKQNNMITKKHFRQDFFEATFNISKKTFLYIMAFTAIMYALLLVVLIPTIFLKLGINGNFIQEYMSLGLMERSDFMISHFLSLGMGNDVLSSMVGTFLLVIVFIGLISSWFYNLIIIFIDKYIKNDAISFVESLKESFSKKIFTTFLMGIIFMIIVIIVEVLVIIPVVLFVQIHMAIAFIVGALATAFLLAFVFRFILALPHIVKTDASSVESLKYSYNKISLVSGLKYAGVMIVAYIAIVIVSILLMSLNSLGTVGLFISSLVQFFMSSFTMSMGFSAILGLYYLYSNEEVLEENTSIENDNSLDLDDNLDMFR